ncbi:CaiB/BaiF CoA transferase family protein [Rhodococcus opacus]|uniref:CaiB/BaiF CoA transferase family protein n=1 Tax=Rhodococcus opacus TaxID=37919 RepID=UPI00106383CC|nr:CaiB/BaiF CoA-transferase family protein [Rhodococcus opacus]MDV6247678.1 CaiB/BaiF CoA-transferase family protein [Rhodococcus opacus]UZG55438.1 CoA transferase [Rhodococcus opacus]
MSNQLPGLLPLDGITVVSFEQAVAAPIATRHLADLGARVIKVERIGEGDFARNYDSAVHGIASHFVWLNRGKESVTVDLKTAEGVSVVRKLVGRADVVVQNLAPGAMDRLGLGAEELRRDRAELIVVNMTGYGTDGPLKDRKAYDMLVQAETGLCSITGTPETATKTGVPASDIAAGMYALTAVQAALFRRERTGVGAVVDVSMFDATVEWLGHPMYLQMYQDTQVQRMGLSHASISPYDAYPTVDGRILIGVQNDRGWRALVTEVFDRPDLVEHPKFATNILRVRHRAETDAVVAEHTRRFDTDELDKRLAAAGVPAARLNDMRDLIDHPQLSERDRWRQIDTEAGQVRAVLPPMTFTDVELPMGPVPALGQHTEAVLTELGLTDATIAGLRTGGTVG